MTTSSFVARLALFAAVAGCEPSAPPSPADAGAARSAAVSSAGAARADMGRVHGTVRYAGAARGTSLYIGLSAQKGEPPKLARQIKWPTYPARFAFIDVPPGDYFLSGYLAMGPDHATGPQQGQDPVIAPIAVKVTAGATSEHELTIDDSGVAGAADGGAVDGGHPADGGHPSDGGASDGGRPR